MKNELVTLFGNDGSAACPEGSIEVHKVCWWKHNSKIGQYSSAKVHRLLDVKRNIDKPKIIDDYNILVNELDILKVAIIDGL
ncbi:CRISPR-associated protein Csd2 [Bacillus cereus]|nr:CRISPR-associated protein Csd2 [Bacillus cereus]PER61161.1 CRISPR-associated protein Csd2 [Bacillus cereus]PEW55144.1 CRISPR-associated protein Csd2 [Bacillus cereus]PEX56744.1 CRISPR-associated protein Csd2 [Bacillus cereus]PEY14888.1 CRISPR-associated protein Csd2 [Bacillus cereus]